MAASCATDALNLGFLTILHQNNGYVGGYLITNLWGRPLEFRLSSPVQPNRIHQILYGGTLQPYLCSDLIGKTLVDKTTTAANYILTDHEAALDLRIHVEVPVVWLAPNQNPKLEDKGLRMEDGQSVHPPRSAILDARCSMLDAPSSVSSTVRCHPRFPDDVPAVRALLERVDGLLDLAEPFMRIREAIGEAHKMGATRRS